MGLDIFLETKSRKGIEKQYSFYKDDNGNELGERAEQINFENGVLELYFRKVPRVVYMILIAKAKEKGLEINETIKFVSLANHMHVDKDEIHEGLTVDDLYSGTILMSKFKEVLNDFKNKGDTETISKELGKSGGFSWGEDSWTTDEEVIKDCEDFIKQAEELDNKGLVENNGSDVVLSYILSW